jgi:multisubunit Na+/H+ antiporter MnhB subunit
MNLSQPITPMSDGIARANARTAKHARHPLAAALPDLITAAVFALVVGLHGRFAAATVSAYVFALMAFEPLAAGGCFALGVGLRDYGWHWRTLTSAAMFGFVYLFLGWIIASGLGQKGLVLAAIWLLYSKLAEGWNAAPEHRARGRALVAVSGISLLLWCGYVAALALLSKHYGWMVVNERGEHVVDMRSGFAAAVGAGYYLLLGGVRWWWRRRA